MMDKICKGRMCFRHFTMRYGGILDKEISRDISYNEITFLLNPVHL